MSDNNQEDNSVKLEFNGQIFTAPRVALEKGSAVLPTGEAVYFNGVSQDGTHQTYERHHLYQGLPPSEIAETLNAAVATKKE